MPQTRHVERHFTAGETVRDIVIGMSDGLTVPFALAAGLTGAINSAGIIVTAGLAEVFLQLRAMLNTTPKSANARNAKSLRYPKKRCAKSLRSSIRTA